MELASGSRTEQREFSAIPDFHGLHGSAFLARCKISDPALFCNPVGEYFADSPNHVNAQGFEKRLGGRIGIFGRIQVGSQTVVVGSTHKLSHHSAAIREHIGPHKAVVAGDDGRGRCKAFGLQNVDDEHVATWPASCSTSGKQRGDNVCSNLDVAKADSVTLPCQQRFGKIEADLSDHAVVSVWLKHA